MSDGPQVIPPKRPGLAAGDMAPAVRPTLSTSPKGAIATTEIACVVLSFLWLGLVGWFFLTLDPVQARVSASDPLGFMMTILGVFLPVALIWVAAAAARTARTMREESARLQAAIDAMRLSYVDQQQLSGLSLKRSMEEKIDAVAKAQAVLGAEVAGLHQDKAPPERVLTAPVRPTPEPQPGLALGQVPEDGDPLPPDDFIRALNFPENERDTEGFRVLRQALAHRPTAQLVSAAQDLLTLFSQDGIFMDDLSVHHADAATWRGFAQGLRGTNMAALGGIRDRTGLALTLGRMKDDAVFRDAVHTFLRTFDQAFSTFCDHATDGEIMRLINTRTGRAFMLCGQVAGSFD
ncbi:hypothetical protein JANAI62_06830 [Jannaschia pagri]|uniref:Uncharacterized protein n=1 Tax=Jannaschia pagri TaxID=2829797 RepID=A0ABQ4NI19_9RHOB|nr:MULTISPECIES: hypothetical protein [unclassified Jannaschia]GIT89833.1 hypothetical protein JANAI61_02910 [Jannaschia sp. AI_61]GIT94060.1 hypothetical protein JANAI62_06830 [Jannaschia sp. AI_62]